MGFNSAFKGLIMHQNNQFNFYAILFGAFNKNRTLFTSTLDLELRKKLVNCYVWSIALYGAETWTLRG